MCGSWRVPFYAMKWVIGRVATIRAASNALFDFQDELIGGDTAARTSAWVP
jgi:hypothetical protein